MTDSHRRAIKYALHIFLIITLGIVVYSGTLHVPFYFDDARQIVKNHLIKDLNSFINLPEVREGEIYADFAARIVTYFTFALNYAMHGLSVEGYHIVNIAIHIINAILVYGLVIISFKTPFLCTRDSGLQTHLIALFSALIFVSHPVQTQAVTYIVQRLTSLATMFYLLSIVFYTQWRLSRKQRAEGKDQQTKHSAPGTLLYAGALISIILAMKSKEIAFTLPLIITLYEFIFFQGEKMKRILFLTPILLTMVIIPAFHLATEKSIDEVQDIADSIIGRGEISRADYLLTQFRIIVTYVRLLIVPINQTLDYDYPVYSSLFQPPVFLSLLLLLAMFSVGVFLLFSSRTRHNPASRLIAFGIFWFFITLAVESSIIPLSLIFEHRLYLPSVGPIIAFTVLLFSTHDKYANRRAAVLLALLVILLAGTSYTRNKVWNEPITFWEDVIRKSPRIARPHSQLGMAFVEEGLLNDAIMEFKTVIILETNINNKEKAYSNLGNAYIELGRVDEFIELYQDMLEKNPDYANAHKKMGFDMEKIISDYRSGIKIGTAQLDAHIRQADAYYRRGRYAEAINAYREVIRLDPNNAELHYDLAALFSQQGRFDEAISEYETVVKLKPEHFEARNNLAGIYSQMGRYDEAIRELQAVLKLKPDLEDALHNLRIVLELKGEQRSK